MVVKAVIEGYARGGGRQYPNKVILRVLDYNGDVSALTGKRVIYRDAKGNVYKGRVIRRHGRRNPLVIAVFDRNLPGQAIGQIALIES
ncbi:MAG: 50S ribosomal protein L35ae [Desulfurococcales archaeon]|nr:50S ribosomal protein L35ae [Desulfurococcales archaeon]